MKKIAISFDLDNTVFDVSELYLEAWRVTGHKTPAATKAARTMTTRKTLRATRRLFSPVVSGGFSPRVLLYSPMAKVEELKG